MTQSTIENFYRSMKNITELHFCSPYLHMEEAIGDLVPHYNDYRYHESIGNVIPPDLVFGREKVNQIRCKRLKARTMNERCRLNPQPAADLLL